MKINELDLATLVFLFSLLSGWGYGLITIDLLLGRAGSIELFMLVVSTGCVLVSLYYLDKIPSRVEREVDYFTEKRWKE